MTRKRGAFPNPDSVRKVLCLAIQKPSEHWPRPIRDWVAAPNHFTLLFEGRVPNRFMILVMGGLVLVIVLAMLLPIFELNQLVK